MPIYRVIKEEIEVMPNIDRSKYPEGGRSETNEKQIGLDSGNAFESLGKSHPEYFDRERLKQIASSENIVEEFNAYFNAFMTSDLSKLNDALGRISILQDNETKNATKEYISLNGTITRMMQSDLNQLISTGVLKPGECADLIQSTYIPESLTENGCRRLIQVRLNNSRLLTDALTKMLKLNYRAFNISQQEAQIMIDKMSDDKTSHEGISLVKKMFEDPKKLAKFKKGNYYDFRSIGGGVIFFSDDDSMKLVEAPSKNLLNIFKYDAIVHAHGTYINTDIFDNKDTIPTDYIKVVKRLNGTLNRVKKLVQSVDDSIDISILDHMIKKTSNENHKPGIFTKVWVAGCLLKLNLILSNVRLSADWDDKDKMNEINNAISQVDKDINSLVIWRDSYNNPKKAIRDGDSVRWMIQPINTLSHRNMTKVVDVVRALKSEGFKNVLIAACNPGSVKLPKDIEDDKSFKVRLSSQSIILESGLEDQIRELDLLKEEFDLLYDKTEYDQLTLEQLLNEKHIIFKDIVLNEGFIDKLKELAKKAWSIIVSIWRKIIEFFRNIFMQIRKFISEKFGQKKSHKMQKSIEINLISFDGNKAKIEKIKCNTPEDIEKAVNSANSTLNSYIRHQSNIEIEGIKRLNEKINSSQISKLKTESFNFFSNIAFI